MKVANDAREQERRREAQEIRRTLLRKLEEDNEECMRRYREINEKWSNILASKDPLDIHAEMEAQNARCMEIMARKEAVIAELRQELENADLKFVNDQKSQNEDIDLLINRMDNQVRYTLLLVTISIGLGVSRTRMFYSDEHHEQSLPSRVIAH